MDVHLFPKNDILQQKNLYINSKYIRLFANSGFPGKELQRCYVSKANQSIQGWYPLPGLKVSVYLSRVTQLVRRTHHPKFVFISPPVDPCTFLWRFSRVLCTHDNYSALCVLLEDVTLCKVKADPMQCRNSLDRMTFVYVCSPIMRDMFFGKKHLFLWIYYLSFDKQDQIQQIYFI